MPSFSHDGRWIYFASNRTGKWNIWKMPTAGGDAVQVTQTEGFTPIESPDGRYVYYARGPATSGLYRSPVGGGPEEAVIPDLQATLYGYWAVTATGIYYAESHAAQTTPGDPKNSSAAGRQGATEIVVSTLRFYSFATKKTVKVGNLPYQLFNWAPGLDISADGRRVMMVLTHDEGSDLKLVENFQ